MIVDIVLAIFSFILAIGFYTGDLDWVLIYYGCAPKSKKDKMNGKLILRIASSAMLIIGFSLVLAVLGHLFWRVGKLVKVGHTLSLITLILMLVSTIKLSLSVK